MQRGASARPGGGYRAGAMTGRRFLVVSTDDPQRAAGGREMLSRLVLELLGAIGTVTVERLTGPTKPWHAAAGRLHGLDGAVLDRLCRRVDEEGITDLFLDGSNLGAVAAAGKRRPGVRITTLFHNAETRFFTARCKAEPGPRALAVLAAHWRAEAMAMRYSDCRIALCQRDSDDLRRLFGRGADAIWPIAVADRWRPETGPADGTPPYLLFVGGGFFGNLGGLEWYAGAVASHLPLRTVAVGRGLEGVAGRLGPAVDLVGAVEDLGPWYAGAALAVAPILSGAGMKTKVAEALMHGKAVVGTPEAFTGYGEAVLAANDCCADAGAMIAAIRRHVDQPPPLFDPRQRALYLADHGTEVALARLAMILR